MLLNETEGAISNEGGTELAGHLGLTQVVGSQNDKVIGAVEIDNDRVILFVVDVVTEYSAGVSAPESEIGLWEKGVYTPLFNPALLAAPGKLSNDLNFKEVYPIEGTFKIDAKGDVVVYWTDDFNPPSLK